MPRFALYAAGAGSKNILNLKRELGYDQLLSQYTERKACVEWVEYLRSHPECTCKLFIDSGAYTAHTKGIEVDVDDYINFINSIDDKVFVFAQVDKIPGRWGQPKTPEELAEAPELSWENYLYMVDKVKSPKKLLPIFHQGEDFKHLWRMLEYQYPNGEYIDYIGISCNKELTTNDWIQWFNEVFKIIRDSKNPNVKTHAFGMTSLKVLEQFPFTSADSTSWVRSAGFGNILIGGSSVYVSSRNPNDSGYVGNLSLALKDSIDSIAKKYGYSLFEVIDEATTEERIKVLNQLTEDYNNYINKVSPYMEVPEINYNNKYLLDIKDEIKAYLQDVYKNLSSLDLNSSNIDIIKSAIVELNEKLDLVKGSGEIRCLFNIASLNEWALNYNYRGTNEFKETLW